jgi:UDP-N-acetylglucosamine:LPS N-acetylglucosamine transferase
MTLADVGTTGRVLVISASVGAGHHGAANELGRRLRRAGLVVDRRDFLDALPRWIRFVLRSGYGPTVTHLPRFYNWLFWTLERPSWIRTICLLITRLGQREVARWCSGASAVVSTYPLASQCLAQLVQRRRLAIPTTTFLTDPAAHSLWVSPYIDRHLTVLPATARLGEAAYATPMTAVGPLVSERFGRKLSAQRRAALRAELGATSGRRLALVVAGSLALGRVRETVEALVETELVVPVVLCGRNQRLLHQLRSRPGVVALGWRNDVHELMNLCDVLVHNAGGMSFSESLVAGLPAVTFACITGHGRANGDVLAHYGIAPTAETVDELREALRRQLDPDACERLRARLPHTGADAASVVLGDIRSARQAMALVSASSSTSRTRSSPTPQESWAEPGHAALEGRP